METKRSLTPLKENIIEVAWLFRDLAETNEKIEYRGDETRELICDIADKFEEKFDGYDWNQEGALLYIEEIQNFAKKEIYDYYEIEM